MKETESSMNITLYGLVQGIGFRPYVVRLAKKWGVKGKVSNEGGAVRILASAPSSVLDGFLSELMENPPPLSEILHVKVERGVKISRKDRLRESFIIGRSGEGGEELVILPADLPVCETCLLEMKDPGNRRFEHPLISCTLCGPRYSIIQKAPYDRCNTAMDSFDFCPECYKEYTHSESRRFHAQTVSCNHCGPVLKFLTLGGSEHHGNQKALRKTAEYLQQGYVVAVKGIGGYHFIASPYNDTTVKALRELKQREQKPFAVCFPNLDFIRAYAEVTPTEESLLKSNARPIVLLEQKQPSGATPFSPLVLQNSRFIGAFLPYTPLLVQICDEIGPVIATSANLSDAPIINREEELKGFNHPLLAGILSHGRDIVISQDDSVACVISGQPQLIRRARGYTPIPIYVSHFEEFTSTQTLAVGGELKSTFCLQKGPYAYISQYLGELGSAEAYKKYIENLNHMKALFKINPQVVACDLHPDYASTRFAESLDLPLIKVQHHHAHIAAVMAEKGLEGPVLGISMDGTGYGSDGTIWGGEFLICEKGDFQRAAYLKPVPLLMGDDSMRDCQKTASAYLHHAGLHDCVYDNRYKVLRQALEHGINTIPSSSMGRLFDSVSSILGLCHWNRYEAEGAILLENAAARAIQKRSGHKHSAIFFDIIEKNGALVLDSEPVIRMLSESIIKGGPTDKIVEELALDFHEAVAAGIAQIILQLRNRTNINDVALSGGVFQNRILAESTIQTLKNNNFNVHIPSMVPANDGGISLGQAFVAMKKLRR